jgi:hypothetical protein
MTLLVVSKCTVRFVSLLVQIIGVGP